MIRLRSAFLIVVAGCVMAFCLGLQAGFFSARSATLAEGIRKWADGMITTIGLGKGGDSAPVSPVSPANTRE
jgi:hypothetical protein